MRHALLASLFLAMQVTPTHDRAFWQSVIEHDYAPPDATQVVPLAHELSSYLASPDPELRDRFAYSILTAWIYQKKLVPPAVERDLLTEWTANLTHEIGSRDTDAVFQRSFSALMLSVMIAHDNADPFLEPAEVKTLLKAALAYLAAEQDVRGYDPKKGWMHSAAHTADLLKFLGRSRFLDASDQAAILHGIARKLREAPEVFTHGEDERYARAILSIVNRKDFDPDGFVTWVSQTAPKPPTNELPDPAVLRGNQNATNLLAKLEVLLTLQEPASPAATAARDSLRTVLKKLY